jgi:sulfur-oxidizing protein SoxY
MSCHDRQRRRLVGQAAAVGAVAATLAAPWASTRAAVGGLPSNTGHDDVSPHWEELRPKLYASRPITTGDASLLQLIIPLRAAYGASVPVKLVTRVPQTGDRYLRQLRFVVDKNPTAVAATLTLTRALGQADFETRLRVDQYSHVRAIGEFSDGTLHMSSRYVKVSGGCSAPPNRDQPHLIGRTSFRIPEGLKKDQPTPAEVRVVHPNDTGFELNQLTVMFIPPHFIRRMTVSYGGGLLFDAEQDFSLSENPNWRFLFVPRDSGVLVAEVEDSKDQRFSGRLEPTAIPA